MTDIMIGLGICVVGLIATYLVTRRKDEEAKLDPEFATPRWVPARVAAVESVVDYLGHVSARITVEVAGESLDEDGMIPGDWERALSPGAAVSARVQYGCVDTVRTEEWSSEPRAILAQIKESLGSLDAQVRKETWGHELDLEHAGRKVVITLNEEGWFATDATSGLDERWDISFFARDPETDDLPDFHDIHGRLATNLEQFEARSAQIGRLQPATLQRLEAFVVATGGEADISEGAVSLDCELLCGRGDLAVALVGEALAIVDAMITDLSGEPGPVEVAATPESGHW